MRKNERPSDDRGKVKFRFVEFELEGLNSTIEETVKNIVHSMGRTSVMQTRVLPERSPGSAALAHANGDGSEELGAEADLVEADPPSEASAAAPTKPRGQRKYTVPSFMSDLDLDSGDLPFKAFAEQQAPRSDNRKYLVIAAWLKKHRALDEISTDHVYTCNQKMNWKTQKDVGQPFRYMKKRSYFEAAGRNQWRITHIGLDQLNTTEEEA